MEMSSLATIVHLLLTLLAATALNEQLGVEKIGIEDRYALIVTLAGSHKLTEYFEWSCRSIGASAQLFDLLVFHENLRALQNVTCAENVHFFNLGYRGVSKALVHAILHSGDRNASSHAHSSTEDKDEDSPLVEVVDRVLQHIPAYVHEMKPLYGQIYEHYLSRYTYWSYTDPDILFGDLTQLIVPSEVRPYHYYSLAKNWDTARLYLRGEFTLHRNEGAVNSLWRLLRFYDAAEFATRLGSVSRAIDMVLSARYSDRHETKGPPPPMETIAQKFLHDPEGWYSQLVILQGAGQIKIAGAVFDDYSTSPLVLQSGCWARCASSSSSSLRSSIAQCIRGARTQTTAKDVEATAATNTQQQENWIVADVYSGNDALSSSASSSSSTSAAEASALAKEAGEACKMAWLPRATRMCAATERFDHRVGGHVHLRLQHLDTSILVRDCAHYASLLTSLKQTTFAGNRTDGSQRQPQLKTTMSRLYTEDLSPEAVHVLEKFVETSSETLMRSAAFIYHNIEQQLHLNSNQQSLHRHDDVPLGCWMYPVTSASPSTVPEERRKNRLRTRTTKADHSSTGNSASNAQAAPASSSIEENHALLFHLNHWDDAIALSKASVKFTDAGSQRDHLLDPCMVLYLRYDRAIVFEPCDTALENERRLGQSILLDHLTLPSLPHRETSEAEDAAEVMRHFQIEHERGVHKSNEKDKDKNAISRGQRPLKTGDQENDASESRNSKVTAQDRGRDRETESTRDPGPLSEQEAQNLQPWELAERQERRKKAVVRQRMQRQHRRRRGREH